MCEKPSTYAGVLAWTSTQVTSKQKHHASPMPGADCEDLDEWVLELHRNSRAAAAAIVVEDGKLPDDYYASSW